MATRNFVPRADGEGKLGTPSKKWGDVYATTVHGALDGNASSATLATNATNDADGSPISSTYAKKDSDYLGYRQSSTAYAVGDIRYHATLPAGWYLECTTAGTTGSGELTITSPTVGGTVSDDTVTWTVRKNASTQDLTGYLPLSGGAMTNTTGMKRNTDDSWIEIDGGTVYTNGAHIALYGKDINNGSDIPGAFRVIATNGVNSAGLIGKPNNELIWDGNSLDKSAVVAESLGTNGYRKYAIGLIEQWGRVEFSAVPANGVSLKQVDLPISFTAKKNVVCSVADVEYATKGHCLANPLSSLTSFNVAMYNDHSDAQDMTACWFAKGY